MNTIIVFTPDLDLVVDPAGKCYFNSWSRHAASQVFKSVDEAVRFFNSGKELQWEGSALAA